MRSVLVYLMFRRVDTSVKTERPDREMDSHSVRMERLTGRRTKIESS